MWFRFVAVAVVSLAHLALAQPEAPKVASVAGTVVDAQDGHFLPRVSVCLLAGATKGFAMRRMRAAISY